MLKSTCRYDNNNYFIEIEPSQMHLWFDRKIESNWTFGLSSKSIDFQNTVANRTKLINGAAIQAYRLTDCPPHLQRVVIVYRVKFNNSNLRLIFQTRLYKFSLRFFFAQWQTIVWSLLFSVVTEGNLKIDRQNNYYRPPKVLHPSFWLCVYPIKLTWN